MLTTKNPSTIAFEDYMEHDDKLCASRCMKKINTGITEVTANSAQATF